MNVASMQYKNYSTPRRSSSRVISMRGPGQGRAGGRSLGLTRLHYAKVFPPPCTLPPTRTCLLLPFFFLFPFLLLLLLLLRTTSGIFGFSSSVGVCWRENAHLIVCIELLMNFCLLAPPEYPWRVYVNVQGLGVCVRACLLCQRVNLMTSFLHVRSGYVC